MNINKEHIVCQICLKQPYLIDDLSNVYNLKILRIRCGCEYHTYYEVLKTNDDEIINFAIQFEDYYLIRYYINELKILNHFSNINISLNKTCFNNIPNLIKNYKKYINIS